MRSSFRARIILIDGVIVRFMFSADLVDAAPARLLIINLLPRNDIVLPSNAVGELGLGDYISESRKIRYDS